MYENVFDELFEFFLYVINFIILDLYSTDNDKLIILNYIMNNI